MDGFQSGSFQWFPNNHGRHLLASPFDSITIRIVIIILCSVIGALLVALVLWLIITKCGRKSSAPVVPAKEDAAAAKGGDVEKGLEVKSAAAPEATPPPEQAISASSAPAPAPAPALAPAPAPALAPAPAPLPALTVIAATAGLTPVPPWQADPTRLPPGIMLAPEIRPIIDQIWSKPRAETEPPYERLVLISSRVHKSEMVAAAVLPNNAHVVYDWKNATLQELLLYIKKALGTQKVTTIAVVAPGPKPGKISLLEGAGTTIEKLDTKTELSQFWRVLSGFVALSGTADGPRIDLVGCRLVEAPQECAALLKELRSLTTVPFAAADDALDGYMLSTFMEEPLSKQLNLVACNISAIDLYFDRFKLLGIPQPGVAPPPPEPPLPTQPALATDQDSKARSSAPPRPTSAPLPATAGQAQTVTDEGQDVFTRLQRALDHQGVTAEEAFREHDRNGDGQLQAAELTGLLGKYLPGTTGLDRKHFQTMVDMDAQPTDREDVFKISQDEFVKGLTDNVELQKLVRERRDEDGVLERLRDYLTKNEQVMRDIFEKYDEDHNGSLDHSELGSLVVSIPGLDARERKFILTYLYHYDNNRDMKLSFEELLKALEAFPETPPPVARAVPPQVGAQADQAQQAAGLPAQQAAASAQAQLQAGQAALQEHAQAAAGQASQAAQAAGAHAQAAAGQASQAAQAAGAHAQAAAGQASQAAQAAGVHAQAAAGQVDTAAQGLLGQAENAAAGAAQSAPGAVAAAPGSLPPLALTPPLAPIGLPPGGRLAPLGGRLAPLPSTGGAVHRSGSF